MAWLYISCQNNLLFLLTIISRRIIIYIIFSILIFIELFRGGLTGVFQIIVPLRIATALELHNMNRWANTFPRYFLLEREFIVPSLTASNSGPEAAKQPQTNRLPPPRLMVVWWSLLWSKPSKKFNFRLISPFFSPNVVRWLLFYFWSATGGHRLT